MRVPAAAPSRDGPRADRIRRQPALFLARGSGAEEFVVARLRQGHMRRSAQRWPRWGLHSVPCGGWGKVVLRAGSGRLVGSWARGRAQMEPAVAGSRRGRGVHHRGARSGQPGIPAGAGAMSNLDAQRTRSRLVPRPPGDPRAESVEPDQCGPGRYHGGGKRGGGVRRAGRAAVKPGR